MNINPQPTSFLDAVGQLTKETNAVEKLISEMNAKSSYYKDIITREKEKLRSLEKRNEILKGNLRVHVSRLYQKTQIAEETLKEVRRVRENVSSLRKQWMKDEAQNVTDLKLFKNQVNDLCSFVIKGLSYFNEDDLRQEEEKIDGEEQQLNIKLAETTAEVDKVCQMIEAMSFKLRPCLEEENDWPLNHRKMVLKLLKDEYEACQCNYQRLHSRNEELKEEIKKLEANRRASFQ